MYHKMPSNPRINTQCLAWSAPNIIWQTSGDFEKSLVVKRSVSSEQIQQWPLDGFYAEGCTPWQQQLLVLSWKSYFLFIYRLPIPKYV